MNSNYKITFSCNNKANIFFLDILYLTKLFCIRERVENNKVVVVVVIVVYKRISLSEVIPKPWGCLYSRVIIGHFVWSYLFSKLIRNINAIRRIWYRYERFSAKRCLRIKETVRKILYTRIQILVSFSKLFNSIWILYYEFQNFLIFNITYIIEYSLNFN